MWRSNLSFPTSLLRLDLLMSSANIFFCFLSILYFTLQLYAIHRLAKQNLTPHFLALIGYICATLRFDSLSLRSCGLNRANLYIGMLHSSLLGCNCAMLYFTELDFNELRCSVPCWDITLLGSTPLNYTQHYRVVLNYAKLRLDKTLLCQDRLRFTILN